MNDEISQHYKFTEEVKISKIRKTEKFWVYSVLESTYKTITHYMVYSSKNLLALTRHRDATIAKYEEKKRRHNTGSWSDHEEVKPTLLEKIRATADQKIR